MIKGIFKTYNTWVKVTKRLSKISDELSDLDKMTGGELSKTVDNNEEQKKEGEQEQ